MEITGSTLDRKTNQAHQVVDDVARQAQTDAATAYNALAGQACDVNLTGQDLGGLVLIPGAYCFSSSAQLTGTLTLDAQGNSNAVWVFQIGSTLTTAVGASVVFINNSPSCCHLFWQVGSSATIGTNTAFAGNILALASITLNTGATMSGKALALNGAVTLDTNDPTAVRVQAFTATSSGNNLPLAGGTAALTSFLALGWVWVQKKQNQ